MTKLAIGKPGGIHSDATQFDTVVSVWCHECEKKLDHRIPEVAALADSLRRAPSAYDAAQVCEWELELKTCEHTDKLDQSGASKIATKA